MTGGMMFKGTPGPWKIIRNMGFAAFDGNQETDDHNNGMGFVGDGDKRVCWFGNRETYYPTQGDEPNEYDAKLIETAPELLEALQKIVKDLEMRAKNGIVDCSQGVYYEAHTAIAKALGEQK